MSAVRPKVDIAERNCDVRVVPIRKMQKTNPKSGMHLGFDL